MATMTDPRYEYEREYRRRMIDEQMRAQRQYGDYSSQVVNGYSYGYGGGGGGGSVYGGACGGAIKLISKPFESLSQLSTQTKERILQVLRGEYIDYLWKRKTKNMTTGIKWFLIFTGFAILVNFGKILELIALIVKK